MKNSVMECISWIFKGAYNLLSVLTGIVFFKLFLVIILFLIFFTFKLFNKAGRKL